MLHRRENTHKISPVVNIGPIRNSLVAVRRIDFAVKFLTSYLVYRSLCGETMLQSNHAELVNWSSLQSLRACTRKEHWVCSWRQDTRTAHTRSSMSDEHIASGRHQLQLYIALIVRLADPCTNPDSPATPRPSTATQGQDKATEYSSSSTQQSRPPAQYLVRPWFLLRQKAARFPRPRRY